MIAAATQAYHDHGQSTTLSQGLTGLMFGPKTTNIQNVLKTQDTQTQNAGAKRYERPSYDSRRPMANFGITKGKQQMKNDVMTNFGITKGKQQMQHEYVEKSDFQGHVSLKKRKPNADSEPSLSDHLSHHTHPPPHTHTHRTHDVHSDFLAIVDVFDSYCRYALPMRRAVFASIAVHVFVRSSDEY